MCQVWCSGIQGIYTQLMGGVPLPWVYVHCLYIYIYLEREREREICHEMCQVWCSGIQGIYAQLGGGRSSGRSRGNLPNFNSL